MGLGSARRNGAPISAGARAAPGPTGPPSQSGCVFIVIQSLIYNIMLTNNMVILINEITVILNERLNNLYYKYISSNYLL